RPAPIGPAIRRSRLPPSRRPPRRPSAPDDRPHRRPGRVSPPRRNRPAGPQCTGRLRLRHHRPSPRSMRSCPDGGARHRAPTPPHLVSATRPPSTPPTPLHIDWTRCHGRGLCTELLPRLLGRDDWGYPVARDGSPQPPVPTLISR